MLCNNQIRNLASARVRQVLQLDLTVARRGGTLLGVFLKVIRDIFTKELTLLFRWCKSTKQKQKVSNNLPISLAGGVFNKFFDFRLINDVVTGALGALHRRATLKYLWCGPEAPRGRESVHHILQ